MLSKAHGSCSCWRQTQQGWPSQVFVFIVLWLESFNVDYQLKSHLTSFRASLSWSRIRLIFTAFFIWRFLILNYWWEWKLNRKTLTPVESSVFIGELRWSCRPCDMFHLSDVLTNDSLRWQTGDGFMTDLIWSCCDLKVMHFKPFCRMLLSDTGAERRRWRAAPWTVVALALALALAWAVNLNCVLLFVMKVSDLGSFVILYILYILYYKFLWRSTRLDTTWCMCFDCSVLDWRRPDSPPLGLRLISIFNIDWSSDVFWSISRSMKWGITVKKHHVSSIYMHEMSHQDVVQVHFSRSDA